MIIFLGNFKRNFNGGQFIFVDTENRKRKNVVVEPKAGRVVGYTAGHENLHVMDKIVDGVNYFIKLSYTCDKASEKEALE